jgi:hypothetical protein
MGDQYTQVHRCWSVHRGDHFIQVHEYWAGSQSNIDQMPRGQLDATATCLQCVLVSLAGV